MKTNKKILNEFGSILINNVFDFNFKMLNHNILKHYKSEDFEEKIKSITKDAISSMIFDVLKIFEENEQFKLYFEENKQKINLVEISEMLKAEPIIENGWIERFSKELNKKE